MLISPVDRKAVDNNRNPSASGRSGEDDAFARLLQAVSAKGKGDASKEERVAVAAEIMRLELMRSAVTLSDSHAEAATPPLSNALKSYLTNYVDSSQKADTNPPVEPLHADIQPAVEQIFAPSTEKISPAVNNQPTSFDAIIANASRRFGVDEGLIKAVIRQESNFNPNAVSRAGARGLMQLMPGTAAGLGVKDSFDPEQNIMAGTRFLRDMLDRYKGDVDSALAAYNWGPGNVDKSRGAFMPRETREYLVKVKRYYADYVG